MTVRLVVSVVAALAVPVAALAADASVTGAGRYELAPNEAGFIRLDTVTGAASHCTPENGGWSCEALAAEGDASGKVEALAAEVARLSSTLVALTGRVDTLAARISSPEKPAVDVSLPEPSVGVIAAILEKFLAMVRILKHGDAAA